MAQPVWQREHPITLENAGAFFMKTDPVHQALAEIGRRLDEEQIAYAIIGGMALGLYGYVRVTQDVDLLLGKEGLETFHRLLVGRGYVPAFSGTRKHFKDVVNRVSVKVITAGEYPGDGKPKEVVFPDPASSTEEIDGLGVIKLEVLIELKLASGLSAPHRIKDLADVQQLIETLDLPREIGYRLKPSVRSEYLRLWEATNAARSSPE
jgi:hypothetical protein